MGTRGLHGLAGPRVLALVAGLVVTVACQAQERVRWKMQSAFPATASVLGETAKRFSEQVEALSRGTLTVKFHAPGTLVPTLEGFAAVKAGSVDALWGTPGYHAGRIPALAWFSAVPFGPRAAEYLAWLEYGGGDAIYDEIYAREGVKGLRCVIAAPETSGWFREEITSLEDLQGLKMRFFGLGARVMQKLGVSTQLIAPGEIYPALERGVVDAAEFSMPSVDLDAGLYRVAKHNYYPGWHQQASPGELLVNRDKWNALSAHHKKIMDTACRESLMWSFVRAEALQYKAMIALKEKGVKLHRWPPEILEAMEAKWQEVVEEESEKDPLFRRAHESFAAFRKDYAVWREHAYLE